MKEPLLCGAARSKITPGPDFFPCETVPGERTFNGVLDDLYLRVIALRAGEETALIVCYDTGQAPLPEKYVPAISKATGVPEDNILYTASHTHTSPISKKVKYGKNDKMDEYERMLFPIAVETAVRAVNSMRPARIGVGYGQSFINVNNKAIYTIRDADNNVVGQRSGAGVRWDGPSDKTLSVIRFEEPSGKPIAFVVNHGTHLCLMYQNKCCDGEMGISGDFGGLAAGYMEERFDGAVAVWCSGAAGDQNPILMNSFTINDPKTGEPKRLRIEGGCYELCLALAARHYDDILRVNDGISCDKDAIEIKAAVDWSSTPARSVTVTGPGTAEYADTDEPYRVRLQLLRLGDIALCGVSGELYASLGMHLKDVSPLRNTIIVTHASATMAGSWYIFDDEAATFGGSGVPTFYRSRQKPGYIKDSLARVMLGLFEQVF